MKKILIFLIFLTGCSQASHEKVETNQFAAVLNIAEPGLTFIDSEGAVLAEWFFEEAYTGGTLVKDQLLLYGHQLDHAVLYSVRTGKETARWDVPVSITSAAYLEKTNEVAFSVQENGSVHFYNEKGKEQKRIRTGQYPMNLLDYQDKLYVINYQDTVLSEININTHEIEREFAIPTSSTGIAINADRKELWVGGHGYGAKAGETIHIYSLKTGALTATADAPVMPVAFTGKAGYMYAASHGSNKLYAFDSQRKNVAEAEAPANPFALNLFGRYLVSAGYDSGEVSFYEEKTLRKMKTIDLEKGSFMILVKDGD